MENIKEIIENSFSINDLCIKLYGYTNGNTIKKANKLIEESNLDISHFGPGKKIRRYKIIIKKCPICNNEFETKEGHRDEKTTCSQSCSNSYFQHGKNNPNFNEIKCEEKYEKISNTLKVVYKLRPKGNRNIKGNTNSKECKNCKCIYKSRRRNQKYCSKLCQFSSSDYKQKLREIVIKRIQNGSHKGWISRNIESFPEKFFKKVLENNNIKYEFNKVVKKKELGIDRNENYFLDFYISNVNIDLEIDGSQHKYRKEHDILRDELLSKSFNVYRIEWKSINSESGKNYIKGEIDKFIEYYKSLL